MAKQLIKDTFERLAMLFREGAFDLEDLRFMEKFLDSALQSTRRLLKEAEKGG